MATASPRSVGSLSKFVFSQDGNAFSSLRSRSPGSAPRFSGAMAETRLGTEKQAPAETSAA
jgi:hypothetical protein